MKQLVFDFNNMFSFTIGPEHGVTERDLKGMMPLVRSSHRHLVSILADKKNRVNLGLEWTQLPYQDAKFIQEVQKLGNDIASRYENVIFLGIGGSYVGLKAAQDALCQPYSTSLNACERAVPVFISKAITLIPKHYRYCLVT